VTVKESHWVEGVESPSGSLSRVGFVPGESCGAVDRLEAEGAVLYATTAVPEFCYFGITESELRGRTSNPWNLDRTPGGSSGGAGAQVAAGAGPLALGGDGGGSIRIPSAFCGMVGYKPTFGLVPHEPSTPGWKTLVSLGPMARSVADARLMLGAMSGHHPLDRHSLEVDLDASPIEPTALRVAVSEDLGFAPLDDDVRQGFRAAVAALADAGVEIVRDDPGLPHSSVQTWGTIATAEARRSEAYELEHERAQLSSAAVEFLLFGDAVTIERYIQAQFVREEIFRAYADLFARTGAVALLTPTLGCEAFGHGRRHPQTIGDVPIEMPWIDWASFLYDANLAGLPACALPIGLGDEGLPVSVQVLGPRASDGVVLAAAETIESILGWSGRPPEPPPEAPTRSRERSAAAGT
jgi:Asp-tRNA(Asn)/Glu-tRNA(Gln) amidotransferase A subunit family amidase